jgi:hypothetical protein
MAPLVSMIRPSLKPRSHEAADGDGTDFVAAEFKDDEHRSMVVIEESC